MTEDRTQDVTKELIKRAIPILTECPELFPLVERAIARANPVDAKSHIYWQIERFLKVICKEVAHHITFFDPYFDAQFSDLLIKAGLLCVIKAFLDPSLDDIKKWEALREKYSF